MELRPSKNLIDPHFDGYKLSLEPIPKTSVDLENEADQVGPSESQYSLQHATIFGLHNHLVRDPWEPRTAYFVDTEWTIQKVKFNLNTSNIQQFGAVYNIPKVDRQIGDFSVSFGFVSEKYCVISDGVGTLKLVDTGDRYSNTNWKCIYSELLKIENKNFIIQDAKLEIGDGMKNIHCILLSVERQDEGHQTKLQWIQISKDSSTGIWSISTFNEIHCKSIPEYCSIEPRHKALLLCLDCAFSFQNNTGNEPEEIKKVRHKFSWSQTDEDVTVSIDIEKNSDKNDFKVICTEKDAKIFFRNNVIFDVTFYERIQCGLTTWSLSILLRIECKQNTRINVEKVKKSVVGCLVCKEEVENIVDEEKFEEEISYKDSEETDLYSELEKHTFNEKNREEGEMSDDEISEENIREDKLYLSNEIDTDRKNKFLKELGNDKDKELDDENRHDEKNELKERSGLDTEISSDILKLDDATESYVKNELDDSSKLDEVISFHILKTGELTRSGEANKFDEENRLDEVGKLDEDTSLDSFFNEKEKKFSNADLIDDQIVEDVKCEDLSFDEESELNNENELLQTHDRFYVKNSFRIDSNIFDEEDDFYSEFGDEIDEMFRILDEEGDLSDEEFDIESNIEKKDNLIEKYGEENKTDEDNVNSEYEFNEENEMDSECDLSDEHYEADDESEFVEVEIETKFPK